MIPLFCLKFQNIIKIYLWMISIMYYNNGLHNLPTTLSAFHIFSILPVQVQMNEIFFVKWWIIITKKGKPIHIKYHMSPKWGIVFFNPFFKRQNELLKKKFRIAAKGASNKTTHKGNMCPHSHQIHVFTVCPLPV